MEKLSYPYHYGKQIRHYSRLTTICKTAPQPRTKQFSQFKRDAAHSSVKSQQQPNKGETTELSCTDGHSGEPGITSYLQGSGM